MSEENAGAQLAIERGAQPSDSREAYSDTFIRKLAADAKRRRAKARRIIAAHPEQFEAATAAKDQLRPSVYYSERELAAALVEREAIRNRFRWRWQVEQVARGDEFEEAAARLALPAGGRPVTLDAFRRHARRFGPEMVVETARDFLSSDELALLEVELAGKKPRQRRTTDRLRAQVSVLQRRGMMRSAIARKLNISDRRVKELLKSETSQNGGRKATVQAEKSAAKASVHVPGRGSV